YWYAAAWKAWAARWMRCCAGCSVRSASRRWSGMAGIDGISTSAQNKGPAGMCRAGPFSCLGQKCTLVLSNTVRPAAWLAEHLVHIEGPASDLELAGQVIGGPQGDAVLRRVGQPVAVVRVDRAG